MSACNIIQGPEAIHIWSDGAVYSPDGALLAISPKTFVLPAINAAVSLTGSLMVAHAVASAVQINNTCFDTLVERLPELVRDAWIEVGAMGEHDALPTVARICGWSNAAARLEAWSAAAGDTAHHVSDKAVFIDPADVLVSPASPELLSRLEVAGLCGPDGLTAETEHQWLQVLREQSACAFPSEAASGKAIKMVGGFAQQTIVTRYGVSVRMVERLEGVQMAPTA